MSNIPELDVHLPGANCLLCVAAAELANTKLSNHTKTLDHDNYPQILTTLSQLIEENGAEGVIINTPLNVKNLKKIKSKTPNTAKYDYSAVAEDKDLTHLLVLNVYALGFHREYSNYFPLSEPKAYLSGTSFLVNLQTNTYEWYTPLEFKKSVGDNWKEPPTFPGLTNAFYHVLASSKSAILEPLKK